MKSKNENNLYNDGDFSHMNIVLHQYFGLQEKCLKCINKILWIIILYIFNIFLVNQNDTYVTKVINFDVNIKK